MGVFRELFGEKWPRDIGSALYLSFPDQNNNAHPLLYIVYMSVVRSHHLIFNKKFTEDLLW